MLLASIDKSSCSAATREINMPVPTPTRKVTDLEVTSATRKLPMTDAGVAYAATARQILELVAEQKREATGEFMRRVGTDDHDAECSSHDSTC